MVGHHDAAAAEIVFVPQPLNPVLVERPYPTSGIPPAPFSVIQVPQSFLNDILMPFLFAPELGCFPLSDEIPAPVSWVPRVETQARHAHRHLQNSDPEESRSMFNVNDTTLVAFILMHHNAILLYPQMECDEYCLSIDSAEVAETLLSRPEGYWIDLRLHHICFTLDQGDIEDGNQISRLLVALGRSRAESSTQTTTQ